MVNINMLHHHHKKISSLPLSVGAIIILDPINSYVAQNAKALGRVRHVSYLKALFQSKPLIIVQDKTLQIHLRPSHKNI